MADINGTNASETLTGTDDNDSINPGNGDDTVYGGAGDDLINAMYSVEGQLSHFNYAGTLTAYGGQVTML